MWWLLLMVPLLLLSLLVARRRTARRLRIQPAGIDERGYVRLGGVRQWVQIRGADRTNPVLLMLHGHGISMVPFTPLLTAWERRFTVVQWDRRPVGRTRMAAKADHADLTFDRLAADGIELVKHLSGRLGVDKVVLLAHSQGSVIGVRMARQSPE